MKRIISRFIALCLSILLISCSSTEDELSHYIKQVKHRRNKAIDPIPEVKPWPKFVYPEQDLRRSPFQPVVNNQIDISSPDIKRPKQPLEAYALDALKFVGTLKQGNAVWGLIIKPDGIVTKVTIGSYMGKNYGRIIAINSDTIKLEETIQLSGHWEKRDITFSLYTPHK